MYCTNSHECTLFSDFRIRLPKSLMQLIEPHNVTGFHELIYPAEPKGILCPTEHLQHYYSEIKDLPLEPGYLFKLNFDKMRLIDNENRIQLHSDTISHIQSESGNIINLVGKGYYFEIWDMNILKST